MSGLTHNTQEKRGGVREEREERSLTLGPLPHLRGYVFRSMMTRFIFATTP